MTGDGKSRPSGLCHDVPWLFYATRPVRSTCNEDVLFNIRVGRASRFRRRPSHCALYTRRNRRIYRPAANRAEFSLRHCEFHPNPLLRYFSEYFDRVRLFRRHGGTFLLRNFSSARDIVASFAGRSDRNGGGEENEDSGWREKREKREREKEKKKADSEDRRGIECHLSWTHGASPRALVECVRQGANRRWRSNRYGVLF